MRIPTRYKNHVLVKDGLFYTLPLKLLPILNEELKNAFDPELQELELAMSRACSDDAQHVGFGNGTPIHYQHLSNERRAPKPVNDATISKLNWKGRSSANINSALKAADARSRRNLDIAQGYAGWLLTQRQFLKEHDSLLGDFVSLNAPSRSPPKRSLGKGKTNKFNNRYQAFLVKWRLARLAAPYLPEPLQPQMPAPSLGALDPIDSVGTVFYFPDIYPVPTRDELRQMLEESLRHQEVPAHLTDWSQIVSSSNQARNQIDRYARVFKLQHYCRILQERHPGAIKRRLGALKTAFAEFFFIEAQSIHRDMLLLRKQLGSDWMQRRHSPATAQ